LVVAAPAVLARRRPAVIWSVEAVALEECGEGGVCVGDGERVKCLERRVEFPERGSGGFSGEAGDPTDGAALEGRVVELEHQLEYLDGIGQGDDAGEVAGGCAYGAEVAAGECAFEAGADNDVRGRHDGERMFADAPVGWRYPAGGDGLSVVASMRVSAAIAGRGRACGSG
jgi:hypothetical protein